MTLHLNDSSVALAQASEEDLRISLAIALYKQEKLTLKQAAQLAEMHWFAFRKEMGNRGFAINYSEEDLAHDIASAQRLSSL